METRMSLHALDKQVARMIPLPRAPLANEFYRALIGEFVGTCFLVSTIVLASAAAHVPQLTIGMTLMTQVFAYGYVSGGHYNPAVTTAVHLVKWKRGEQPSNLAGFLVFDWLREVISQMLGGFSGALLAWFIAGKRWSDTNYPAPVPETSDAIDMGRAFVGEMFFTFTLCSVVLNCTVSKHYGSGGNQFFGLAIGMAVFAGASCMRTVSGGALNPAVATALQLVQTMALKNDTIHSLQYVWVYWLSEMAAAYIAALMFCAISCEDKVLEHEREGEAPSRLMQSQSQSPSEPNEKTALVNSFP